MLIKGLLKKVRKLMHDDPGLTQNKQISEQLAWLFFLKIYDYKETEWENKNNKYQSIIPENLRWRNWAIQQDDETTLTGRELLKFVNIQLLPGLKNIKYNQNSPMHEKIIYYIFQNIENHSKDGYILKAVINEFNNIQLNNPEDCENLANHYTDALIDFLKFSDTKEYYTPKGICDFIAQELNPKTEGQVMDLCCGTGGLLYSILKIQEEKLETTEQWDAYNHHVHGIEKNCLPYLTCVTNLLLHGVDEPHIYHRDAFSEKTLKLLENRKFKTIVLNPPFEGTTDKDWEHEILENKKLEDNFLELAMEYLDSYGQAAIIISDDFFSESGLKKRQIKEKLFKEYNLHTVIRLPPTVYAPYTKVKTNILFFCNNGNTKKTWFYRLDMPEGYKTFSLENPIELKHFEKLSEWMKDKHEIIINGNYKAKKCSIDEIKLNEYKLTYCNIPYIKNSLPPEELIDNYLTESKQYSKEINETLDRIKNKIKD